MKAMSETQKNINIRIATGAIFFLVIIFLICLPRRNALKKANNNLKDIESQIRHIESMIDATDKMGEGIKRLQDQLEQINKKFPQKEEIALNALSDLAQELKINVKSIRTQPKKEFVDEQKKPVLVGGRKCQSLSVSMDLKASYKELIDYLGLLKKSLPAYVMIESVTITKESLMVSKLNVQLELNIYLLS